MSEWQRSTCEREPEQLRPEVLAALLAHNQQYQLGVALKDALICVETRSVKQKKGLFGRGESQTVTVTALVTPRWLIWAIEEKTIAVLSARLQNLTVTDYQDSPAYRMISDAGLDVTGVLTGRVGEDERPYTAAFIGLGSEPAAAKFKETLMRAAQAARPE